MAFSMVGRIFFSCDAVWEDEADDAANMRWVPSVLREVEPLAIGHYVGEADLLAAPSRARHSYARPNWERLHALRRRFDPDGLFQAYLAPTGPPDATDGPAI
jgi:FAD/FMN-containing dehydrogenase